MKYCLIAFTLLVSLGSKAQNDIKPLTFSGYAELYYSYDFSKPYNNEKANFLYNYKRHNEVNLNLAFAKASYLKGKVRGNLGLMVGNYSQYNLATEPTWSQFVYEANVGTKLSDKHNIWIDAGIMPSHIGFESAVGADCWTLTRSILAENSPYFEAGVKVSHTSHDDRLQLAFFVLNGWQQIQQVYHNQSPAFGVQINYKSSDKLTLNYSNFVGKNFAAIKGGYRLFHNLYAIYQPTAKLSFTFGFDLGRDKSNTNKYANWVAPIILTRYAINETNKLALRFEYYSDPKEILVNASNINGFNVWGTSLNYDLQIQDNMLWRTEVKRYQSEGGYFDGESKNVTITTSLSIKL